MPFPKGDPDRPQLAPAYGAGAISSHEFLRVGRPQFFVSGFFGPSAAASISAAGNSLVRSFKSAARWISPDATRGSFVVFAIRSNVAAASRAKEV